MPPYAVGEDFQFVFIFLIFICIPQRCKVRLIHSFGGSELYGSAHLPTTGKNSFTSFYIYRLRLPTHKTVINFTLSGNQLRIYRYQLTAAYPKPIANGYAAGVAVSPSGLISEGGGQNIFLVRDDLLITPFLDGSSLRGITRDAVVTIAHDLGYEVREQHVPRESLYIADELFFTGTATEVTPIRSVDRIEIGEGKAGPVSLAIQERYFQLVRGEVEDPHGWRTVVPD